MNEGKQLTEFPSETDESADRQCTLNPKTKQKNVIDIVSDNIRDAAATDAEEPPVASSEETSDVRIFPGAVSPEVAQGLVTLSGGAPLEGSLQADLMGGRGLFSGKEENQATSGGRGASRLSPLHGSKLPGKLQTIARPSGVRWSNEEIMRRLFMENVLGGFNREKCFN
ncbi:hypothetical protein CAPTEDRAFT_186695 [Capitella teleta]|uniref:Uncharacterized protein n=1 Tax=Capitella teleta TaxID=283909 RepID=R7TQX0_CAPTE|nr:hypothetical protein CAPTEDRAFT_186695 [Capitella teleta]|eukprot:ELT95972.1 hypothetical protein CAPTEDRAFT_186695 [Capitella teleta]